MVCLSRLAHIYCPINLQVFSQSQGKPCGKICVGAIKPSQLKAEWIRQLKWLWAWSWAGTETGAVNEAGKWAIKLC